MTADYSKNTYSAVVIRWVDGDTVQLCVDLGQNVSVTDKYRLARIDAPETALRSGVTPAEKAAGLALKEELIGLFPPGERCVARTSKAGKFGRWLVELEFNMESGGTLNLSDWLLSSGRAEAY